MIDLRGLGLDLRQIGTNGNGVIDADDDGTSVEGEALTVSLRGGAIELAGVTALAASDLLI